ncbi:MAG: 2-oxo acid dehydrogenase subunit E2 [Paraglaciecola sp.]|uniref:2-oxo acid dehydrogenase subunit E2 n=1 Tax=Paraglaciecola sp. TaxID=1920173 RepID=UPI00329897B8
MKDFILPDIGEGIVECEVVKWLIVEGQKIKEDDPVVEVMTDKALVEIPAKYSGVVTKLYYGEGEVAKVHFPLFSIDTVSSNTRQVNETVLPNAEISADNSPSKVEWQTKNIESTPSKALASPAVRRLAKEMGIDLATVKGTGDKGRVLRDDLSQFVVSDSDDKSNKANNTVEVIKGVKASMAKKMSHAALTVPHFSVSEEIQLDKLIDVKSQLLDTYIQKQLKLTFMPFFIKAISLALHQFPIINAQVNDDCSEITYMDTHNIGFAIDSKVGLLVPNIKGVERLSIMDITSQYNELVDRARLGRVKTEELKGGTITVSNIGVLGGTVATPIINTPESAILALGRIQRLPRFNEQDKAIAVNIMQVSWSADHRIIDGSTLVKFNNLLKSYIENPISLLHPL